ncbi:hypothetical protein PEC301653_11740 [Pectobacterium carotovorum subsp. carotovorum]|nr:hypothetical protein PCC21_013670 [Pectobacterium carotovorum subsp. carotovorum PCC21]GKV98128.1 hypothetical protein PEC301653_11740 [Pectobacterium carotovorum subsp. carotovorum]
MIFRFFTLKIGRLFTLEKFLNYAIFVPVYRQ